MFLSNKRTILGMLLVVTLSSAPSAALAQSCDADVVEVEVPYFGPRDVVEDCLADAKIPNWRGLTQVVAWEPPIKSMLLGPVSCFVFVFFSFFFPVPPTLVDFTFISSRGCGAGHPHFTIVNFMARGPALSCKTCV